MAGNANPIYSAKGAIGFANTAATSNNTVGSTITNDYSGAGPGNLVIFTADATNGGYVQRVRLKANGTNAVAVARFYINNGSANNSSLNNSLYGEVSLPSTTASTTSATAEIDYPINVALPPGYRIVMGISAAATLTGGWVPTVIGGTY